MVYSYSESVLKIAIAQLAQNVGWHAIGTNSFEILIDLCARYMKEIGKLSTCFANQYNRTNVNFDDIQLAFNSLGISLNELEDYYTHVDAIPFVKEIAKYPVKLQNVKRINYPDQNELKARAEFYEEWLPSIKFDTEQDELLNSKLNKDNDLNDEQNLNSQELNEEELDKRYLNSFKQQLGSDNKISGYTNLEALVPNYIYLSEQGQALSYGGKEGKLPESRLPPLTAEDIERIELEEQKRKLEQQKEKTFQPLKLKINNKEKFKKYLKDSKFKNTDYSKELLKRAKKDKKLKQKVNLNKLSIKMSLNQNNHLNNKDKSDDNDSLKQKQDLFETAEKLGLNEEIDQLKKLNKLKESKIKEKKIKVLKEEDIEKQRRKQERQLKKQELEARKQKLREEKRLKREAREREKEEKRKARERKREERLKEKLEKQRKKMIKKNKQIQSKAEIDDDSNSNFSLNSSLTSSNINNTNNSSLNEYDEKEAANILVSLSEDKKTNKKSNKKQQKSNKPISPINSDSEESDLSEEDDKSESEISEISSSSSSSSSEDEEDSKPIKKQNNSSKNNSKIKIKSNDLMKDNKQKTNDKSSDNHNNKNINTKNTNNEQPVKPFKSLAERKAMPPEIMNPVTSTPSSSSNITPTTPAVTNKSTVTKKENKIKKRKLETKNDSLDNLFEPMFTIPQAIKKPEKKPLPKKKLTNDFIESSSSSSEDEKALIPKKKDKKKKDETLPKLTVKLPSNKTKSPMSPPKSKSSNNLLSIKKDDKKIKKELINDKLKKKEHHDKINKKPEFKLSGSGKFSKSNNSNTTTLNKTINEQSIENRPKKKAKVIITLTKAARKEAAEKGCVLVTQTVSTNDTDEREWICPSCSKPDDGSPMIGCDNCNNWFHWSCLGITKDPAEDSWFCSACINKQQQIEMKFKKKRKPDEQEETNSHINNVASSKTNKTESIKESSSKNNDNKHNEKEHKKSNKKETVRDSMQPSTSSKNDLVNNDLYICPGCNKPDDGSPMIGCDKCDKWYHYPCAKIFVEPKEDEKWFCTNCQKRQRVQTESLSHKHKKQKKN